MSSGNGTPIYRMVITRFSLSIRFSTNFLCGPLSCPVSQTRSTGRLFRLCGARSQQFTPIRLVSPTRSFCSIPSLTTSHVSNSKACAVGRLPHVWLGRRKDRERAQATPMSFMSSGDGNEALLAWEEVYNTIMPHQSLGRTNLGRVS